MFNNTVLGEYDYERARAVAGSLEPVALQLAAGYLVSVFGLRYFMSEQKPFDLKKPLIAWNGLLSLFSLAGFLFTFPTFLRVAYTHGITHTHRHISELYLDSTCGYWVWMWVLSKVPEYVDTLFLVLRKKPLMTMHWYHHALTGYYALVCFHEGDAHMVWVIWMNYIIHFAMYGYYMLRALGVKVPAYVAQTITTSQMIQFIFGMWAQLDAAHQSITGKKTDVSLRGFFIGFFMLSTYFILWARFYQESYLKKGGKKYLRDKEDKTQQSITKTE